MPRLIERRMEPLIDEAIDDARIVFVAGARQVGKTTLIRKITRPDGARPMREVSLDDKAARDAANGDPAGFVAGLDGPAFIDEIHRAPDLLLELKKAVDADTVPGRFLITGSANVLASKKILDALPGTDRPLHALAAGASRDRGRSHQLRRRALRGAHLHRSPALPLACRPTRIASSPAASPRPANATRGGRARDGSTATSPDRWSVTSRSWLTSGVPMTPSICCGCSRRRPPTCSRPIRSPASSAWTTRRSRATSD